MVNGSDLQYIILHFVGEALRKFSLNLRKFRKYSNEFSGKFCEY